MNTYFVNVIANTKRSNTNLCITWTNISNEFLSIYHDNHLSYLGKNEYKHIFIPDLSRYFRLIIN